MGRRVVVKLVCHLEEGATNTPASVGHRLLACCQVLFPRSVLATGRVASISFSSAREEIHGEEGWVPIATVVGTNCMPGRSAGVVSAALDSFDREGISPRWRGLELMSADRLAGKL